MRHRKELGRAVALALLALGALAHRAGAGELSDRQIIDGLKASKPITRSLSGTTTPAATPDMSASDIAFLNRIRRTRSLSLGEREHVAAIAKSRPAIDLEIYFDYDSAELTPKAEPQLNSLGKALTSSELTGSVILLGGHTDAKGSDGYNRTLSERRAETVKKFLVENYRIPAENLVATGYGKTDLKIASAPFAPENRRVQIVNMTKQDTASK